MYLCYDIRGIQSFIFQIPRLKYIIGGSALIDRLDRETVPALARARGWELIFSGGGKGAFRCASPEQAGEIRKALVPEAHRFGADIRFGMHEEYSEAVHCADQLFPYLPASLKGHPCPESGLYPVEDGEPHEVVRRRNWSCGEHLGRWFEKRLLEKGVLALPPGLACGELAFLRDADEGTPGYRALGGRNRWAVICMDGNDMGSQFRAVTGAARSEGDLLAWVKELGKALDACSEKACLAGMQRGLAEWAGDAEVARGLQTGAYRREGEIILPLRPLVVGGDDIAVVCHAGYAATFVLEACRAFEMHSEALAAEARKRGIDLWPATGGRVTISAGVLYCRTSLPLATAIPYAESLLALAKGRGRRLRRDRIGEPAPACVDFEAVTESLLDAPLSRREREVVFLDADLNNERVELSRRPYTAADFECLLEAARRLRLPGSILHQLLPGLRNGYHDRQVFRWRLGKHHEALFHALDESPLERGGSDPGGRSRWRREQRDGGQWCRHTDLIDMALLAQEDRRMAQETTNG